MNKPNCYTCRHRRRISWSAHSQCDHPAVQQALQGLDTKALLALFSQDFNPKTSPLAQGLGIQGSDWGVRHGWFNWPWDFDPIWLEACQGFEPRGDTREGQEGEGG